MTIKTKVIGNIREIMKKWFYTEEEIDSKVEDINTAINGKAEKAHSHDDRYYTESEMDSKLNDKSNTNHTHDTRYYLKEEVDSKEQALQLALDSLVGFTAQIVDTLPATGEEGVMYLILSDEGIEYDIYNEYIYVNNTFEKIGNTNVEVDLSGYATVNFVNSSLANYYNKSEVDTKVNGKANSSHSHDDRYYTETEMDSKLNGKANTNHTHSISNVSNLQSSLDGKANSSHSHDDRYYTETEINTKLGTKSDNTHTHTNLQHTKIGPNTDFNTLTTSGIYTISWDNAQTATNMPHKQKGTLKVTQSQGSEVYQIFEDIIPSPTVVIYIRCYNNYQGIGWSPWKQVSMSGHSHNLEDITDYFTTSTHTLAAGATLTKRAGVVQLILNNWQYTGKTPHTWQEVFTIPYAYAKRDGTTENVYGNIVSEEKMVCNNDKVKLYPVSASGSIFGTITWFTD